MKICIECKEPKYNWQMEKYSWTVYYLPYGFSKRLKICKSCFATKVFELKKSLDK